MFDILANGATVAVNFDPLTDAGGSNTADVRAFGVVSPAADGKLHLHFLTKHALKGVAFINGIELIPLAGAAPEGSLPIRWVASDSAVYDSQRRLWHPDEHSYGGRLRTYNEPVEDGGDPALYRSERFGHFSYAIPAPPGTYTLKLYFSEHWFGIPNYSGGDSFGKRLFDVFCNGAALLRDFDVAREAGGPLRAVSRTFRGLKPNAQGKFVVLFVPSRDYACINALELMREGN